ncbi:MAG: prolipoprotein diacylglyceryl transferase [Chloroflexi bacterium]|nr:prolipoprotein diacylglyceryl transferase [Chloroflexota bacterium]
MIDPVIFSFHIGSFEFALRWYGVFVMTGVVVAAWFAGREVTRQGENGESIWDALVWILPAGIIGARLWYVVNATLGGNAYYLQNPVQILNIPQGGLHFYGGLLFGAVAIVFYLRHYKMDIWLFLDAIAPVTLIGQAIARPANFINQELYGQPTSLPWGISIDAAHRIGVYQDLVQFPLATTRFHPAFAYEMLWNFLAFGLILYLSRRLVGQIKPGAVFFGWLILAGVGRFLIEFFRPDQPRVAGTWISTTQVVTLLMTLTGVVMLAYRYGKLKLPLPPLPEKYQVAPVSVGVKATKKS